MISRKCFRPVPLTDITVSPRFLTVQVWNGSLTVLRIHVEDDNQTEGVVSSSLNLNSYRSQRNANRGTK